MEFSYLNMAHFCSRKADKQLRSRKFDEAMENNQKAAEYFENALKTSTTAKALESIRLQKNYHLRQNELIKIKKMQFEKYKKALEYHRKKNNVENCTELCNITESEDTKDSNQLQIAIYRTMEEADSLLEILNQRGNDSEDNQCKEIKTEDTLIVKPSSSAGSVLPKNETVVIEELRTLNHQLHILVYQLVTKLEDSLNVTEVLQSKISQLENNSSSDADIKLAQKMNDPEVQMSTDMAEKYVYHSSSEDVSPDAIEALELPVLAPLELPSFDLNTLVLSNDASLSTNNNKSKDEKPSENDLF